jgi:hypothetical protein
MDYVEGTDAAESIRDRFPAGMSTRDACAIVTAVAGALDYTHQRGLLGTNAVRQHQKDSHRATRERCTGRRSSRHARATWRPASSWPTPRCLWPRLRRPRTALMKPGPNRTAYKLAKSSGTSTLCSSRTSRGTTSRVRSWVDASTTGAAQPSWWARSQFSAVTHQRSPGRRPGNRYSGTGVNKSLPMERWCSRNAAVTTAQMVCRPTSSGPLEQQPSR